MRFLAPIAILSTLLAGFAEASARPNILFIFSDDHRHDLLGKVNPRVRTPPPRRT